MAGNETLSARNRAALDKWYTQLTDIETELRHYRDQFKGKVVFCNCDDPYESNFFKFFAMSFNHLGLKRLITTCYAGSPISGEQLPLLETAGLRDTHGAIRKKKRHFGNSVQGCPRCDGWLQSKVGQYGPFLGCSNWPACVFTQANRCR